MTDSIHITVSGPQGIGKTQVIEQIFNAIAADRMSRLKLLPDVSSQVFENPDGDMIGAIRLSDTSRAVPIFLREVMIGAIRLPATSRAVPIFLREVQTR